MAYLEKQLKSLACGEKFYINATNLSPEDIAFLREAIRTGRVFPYPENFEMFSKRANIWQAVASGEIIAPQGEYVKLQEFAKMTEARRVLENYLDNEQYVFHYAVHMPKSEFCKLKAAYFENGDTFTEMILRCADMVKAEFTQKLCEMLGEEIGKEC